MARAASTKRAKPSNLGTVRQRSSGRYTASYSIDGHRYRAPRSFATKSEAEAWLIAERADRMRGVWQDPRAGKVNLSDYLKDWLASRVPRLAERTAKSYTTAIQRWIAPRLEDTDGHNVELGALDVSQITPAVVRKWYTIMTANATSAALQRLTYTPSGHPARIWAQSQDIEVHPTGRVPRAVLAAWQKAGSPEPQPQLRAGAQHVEPGRATAAIAYTTLHAAMNSAVDDGLISANPCRIRGAATHTAQERGTCTPAEVVTLAEGMPEHLRAAVIVAAWSGLRHGELFALARRHIDLSAATIRVERSLNRDGKVVGRTKTAGSVRTVHLPRFIADELARHMATFTAAGPDALIFATASGNPYTSRAISPLFKRARAGIGRPELHWHDLRHTGATLAYREGASVKDVQRRLGHTTARAAMIYAHVADESDALLAERLDAAYGQLIEFPRRQAS